MSGRLVGKVALVTGAASGIGRSVATRFASEGATVICADRNLEGAAETADRCAGPSRARAVLMDIAEEGSVSAAFGDVAEAGLQPDVVVANAGVQLFGRDAAAGDLSLEV